MQRIEMLRATMQRFVANAVGLSARQPRYLLGAVRTRGMEADILSLPIDDDQWAPMQDDQGNFFHMADESLLDQHPIR